jgi:hypothetical protein
MNFLRKLTGMLLLILWAIQTISAQNLTQTIRGSVVDKVSLAPLPGAVVILVNSNPRKGATADENGNFKLTAVPIGQQSLQVRMLGYKEQTVPNIVVNSGKEVVLTIPLEENVVQGKEIVVTNKIEKDKPLNDMSVVSTRTFSVEETRKYAAAVNDPLRMATAFPGVIQMNDGNNNISIRGNSPNGLLWRMEGVDIPNPNHFSSVGSSGGGISILSSQLLTNSDFSTGAFPAEYGDGLSGVFDLKLRKGNNEKPEYTLQAGFLGIDAAAEGPFKKGYDGSYLINYRYSTLSLLGKMGVPIGDAVTNFQDLSFNFYMPTKKLGTFTFFGFGGLSSQASKAKKDTTLWTNDFRRYNQSFHANTGAVALTNTKIINSKTYLKTALALSGTSNGFDVSQLDYDLTAHDVYSQEYLQKKITLSSVLNNKIDARSSLRSGIIVNRIGYNVSQKQYFDSLAAFKEYLKNDGTAYTLQAFSEWQYHISERLTSNLGLHYFRFFLNGSTSLEPRASLKYALTHNQALSFGYGLHSQLQPIGAYFVETKNSDGTMSLPSKSLGFSKAHHFVVGYDIMPLDYLHFKVETYYQYLFNIPISADPTNNFSMINSEQGIDEQASQLVNKGKGRNYGVEFTIEQFTHNNFYLLSSISLYDSKYQASNGVWYNTRYNGNYAFSLTAGKDITLKHNILGLNIKSIYSGGLRDVPLNDQASLAQDKAVYDYSRAYEYQNPAYFRTDIRISLKHNYTHATGTLALDVQNVTDRKNYGGRYYDQTTHKIQYYYQVPLLPVLSYRLEF